MKGGGGDNPVMENVSNNSPASLGLGDLSAPAPAPAAGFGLEDQSSTIPAMPTMTTGSSDLAEPVPSSVFKDEAASPAAPAAAPSPDEQVQT